MGRSGDIPKAATNEAGQLGTDDSGCPILHVDMDAFFASVEIRRRPELRGRPVAVGGQKRGVVAAASYEARKYGVRSAMPMGQALRLCPQLIVIPPDRAEYSAASARVMAILNDVTPLVQPLSLDEAFLDVSGAERLMGSPATIAAGIRRRVRDELGLTCSVGVASTKFVAKLASARCKPDGLLVVPAAKTLQFLHPLPVTVLWGVGARTGETLHRLGIQTVADVVQTPLETLVRALGKATAAHVYDLANGIDPRPVEVGEIEKSISADRTLAEDLTTAEEVHRELLRVAGEVGQRLRERRFLARTVGIKIRFSDFKTVTRARTLSEPTDSTAALHRVAVELYDAMRLQDPAIRLVGMKGENLLAVDTTPLQLTLEGMSGMGLGNCDAGEPSPSSTPNADEDDPRRRAEAVLDAARVRFGPSGLRYATLLRSPTEPEPIAHPSRNVDRRSEPHRGPDHLQT